MSKVRWYMTPEVYDAYLKAVGDLSRAMEDKDTIAIQQAEDLIKSLPDRPSSSDHDTVVPTILPPDRKIISIPN